MIAVAICREEGADIDLAKGDISVHANELEYSEDVSTGSIVR